MKEYIELIGFYAASVATIIGLIALLYRISGRFSRYISTKIVQNANIYKTNRLKRYYGVEESIMEILEKLSELESIKLSIKRLEYLNVRQHNEDDIITINSIYDEYKELGGNSYIDMDYERWSKEQQEKTNKAKKKAAKENRTA